MHQSRQDSAGIAHPDGWGIAWYEDGLPRVERSIKSAYEDLWFSTTAEKVYAQTIIAHVRRASVGKVRIENTHPFIHNVWTFAHNGTITGFEQLQSQLRSEVSPPLAICREGTTDSELVFYWLLSRLQHMGQPLGEQCQDVDLVVHLMTRAIPELARRSDELSPERPARLNIVLSDGRMLVAVRWNQTLYLAMRQDVHDCEICGIPHIRHDASIPYRATVVASEKITHEPWLELPNRSLLIANGSGDLRTISLVS